MSHFLEVAYKVLSEVGHPLSTKEIAQLGLKRGWLRTHGKTPWHTMKSRLSTDILKGQSRFMRTDKGVFGLREWNENRFGEYTAERFTKGILKENIVVFPASSLMQYIPGPGLHTTPLRNSGELTTECQPMARRLAEEDHSVIQLVSVFIVKFGALYLTYKRTKRLPESRLHGYYSMAFGGHLNPEDIVPLFDIFDPEYGASLLVRELSEEIIFPLDQRPTIIYKGLLYDDSREVSSQHLGITYDVILKSPDYEIGERGFLMDPRLETLSEIEARLGDFENWSHLIAKHERETLERGG